MDKNKAEKVVTLNMKELPRPIVWLYRRIAFDVLTGELWSSYDRETPSNHGHVIEWVVDKHTDTTKLLAVVEPLTNLILETCVLDDDGGLTIEGVAEEAYKKISALCEATHHGVFERHAAERGELIEPPKDAKDRIEDLTGTLMLLIGK